MKRLFFLFALAIVATGAMAQGPQGSRGHHNDRHGHGADGNGLLLRRQTAGVPQIRLSLLSGQRELPVVAREFHIQV